MFFHRVTPQERAAVRSTAALSNTCCSLHIPLQPKTGESKGSPTLGSWKKSCHYRQLAGTGTSGCSWRVPRKRRGCGLNCQISNMTPCFWSAAAYSDKGASGWECLGVLPTQTGCKHHVVRAQSLSLLSALLAPQIVLPKISTVCMCEHCPSLSGLEASSSRAFIGSACPEPRVLQSTCKEPGERITGSVVTGS